MCIRDRDKSVSVYRDQLFKAVVRGMKDVEDSDYEIPERLASTLRSYQKVGYRWLKSLDAYGFGGILADEMGLGKTIQVIALLLDEKAENGGTSLVVCPASLVYNWAAECEKFTQDLTIEVVAVTKAQRRQLIATGAQQWNNSPAPNESQQPDVVITSYDLLRRDVDDYADCRFALMALDEAQYIKNHATKLAKAVKQITAEHRFALTGTPIENRLSELWSIFDFLMPGLLGTYTKFREKYEQPIMAPGPEHSVMADKLQALVGPVSYTHLTLPTKRIV